MPHELQTRLQAIRDGFAAELVPQGSGFSGVRLRMRPGGGLIPAGRAGEGARPWRSRACAKASSEGRRVYAVGDVHGRFDLLNTLLPRIAADAAGREYALILCGDYVDRGPDSALVLEALLALRRRLGPQLCLLKGNHEQALLMFLDDPLGAETWLHRFGGAATLASYGVAPPTPGACLNALTAARDELMARMPASHLRLLQDLDLMAVLGDYAFVHAGVSPDAPLARQSEDDLLWTRRDFVEARGPFEKIIVHGHTWSEDRPALLGHRIGVDTGAYETGVLTAVGIEDDRRRTVQALDEAATRRRAAEASARGPRLVTRPADYVRAPAGAFGAPALSLGGA